MSANTPLFPCYSPYPVEFERGEGCRLFDRSGRDWIDFSSGIGVVSLGHAHPMLVQTLHTQASKIWHLSNLHHVSGQTELARKIVGRTFADRVFFTNSGTEAIECAIKASRRFHYLAGDSERTRILTFDGAFHGRSLTACAAGGEKFLEGFGEPLPDFFQLPFGDIDAMERSVDGTTAAVLVETIQGEGGIRMAGGPFLTRLRKACDDTGTLLILDEIQCGMGRTGQLFAFEAVGIEPDIAVIAKGLGGGFPVGACLATLSVASALGHGTHGTTFGGNPLAMAVADAVWTTIEDQEFLANIRETGVSLQQALSQLIQLDTNPFDFIRGCGLMWGLGCVPGVRARDVVERLRNAGILTAPAAENIVRILPPLVVNDTIIREAVDRMKVAFENPQFEPVE